MFIYYFLAFLLCWFINMSVKVHNAHVIWVCTPGVSIHTLCQMSDDMWVFTPYVSVHTLCQMSYECSHLLYIYGPPGFEIIILSTASQWPPAACWWTHLLLHLLLLTGRPPRDDLWIYVTSGGFSLRYVTMYSFSNLEL